MSHESSRSGAQLNELIKATILANHKLGDETSISGLVQATQKLWGQFFDDSLCFWEIHLLSGVPRIIAGNEDSVNGVSAALLDRELKMIPVSEISFQEVHHLSIGNQQVNLFFLKGLEGPQGMFVWAGSGVGGKDLHKQLLLSQVSAFNSWCTRFQTAQDLLHRDDLTDLYNYRYLDSCLDSEIKRVQRFQTNFSLLFIDLDSFKPINDSYGHLAGSQVLKQIADVLRMELRDVDSIFRYGGDEFVILLLEADSKKALGVAERLREKIATYDFLVGEKRIAHVTASIGVACCPEHGIDKESLLKLADDSMYRSKRGGKNRVVVVGGGHQKEEPVSDNKDRV